MANLIIDTLSILIIIGGSVWYVFFQKEDDNA